MQVSHRSHTQRRENPLWGDALNNVLGPRWCLSTPNRSFVPGCGVVTNKPVQQNTYHVISKLHRMNVPASEAAKQFGVYRGVPRHSRHRRCIDECLDQLPMNDGEHRQDTVVPAAGKIRPVRGELQGRYCASIGTKNRLRFIFRRHGRGEEQPPRAQQRSHKGSLSIIITGREALNTTTFTKRQHVNRASFSSGR